MPSYPIRVSENSNTFILDALWSTSADLQAVSCIVLTYDTLTREFTPYWSTMSMWTGRDELEGARYAAQYGNTFPINGACIDTLFGDRLASIRFMATHLGESK